MNILNVFKTKLFEALLKGVVPQYFARMLLLLTKEMDLKFCSHRLALAIKIVLEFNIFCNRNVKLLVAPLCTANLI